MRDALVVLGISAVSVGVAFIIWLCWTVGKFLFAWDESKGDSCE